MTVFICAILLVVYLRRNNNQKQLDPNFQAAIERIHDGKILFNPPHDMDQGKVERVEVRISYDDINQAITNNLKGKGNPELDNIHAGQEMSATLSGDKDAFNIKEYSSAKQVVSGRPYAQWEWDVTPLAYGTQTLHLKVVINLDGVKAYPVAYDIPVIDKAVNVKMNPVFIAKQAAKDKETRDLLIGGGSVAASLAAIYGLLKAWRLRKKKQQGKPWETVTDNIEKPPTKEDSITRT